MDFSHFTENILGHFSTLWQQKATKVVTAVVTALIALIFVTYSLCLQAPSNFPMNSIYTVRLGEGLNNIAADLKNESIIKSEFFFKAFSILFGGTKGIMAGDYVIGEKENVITIALRLSGGDYNLIPIKVTIPEGLNIKEISKIISAKYMTIKPENFIISAAKSEGYLFPDTYNFLPNVSAEEIISEMSDNFNKRIMLVDKEIRSFNKPLTDVIKMASILEEEARTNESRRIVADILWKRLSLGMPLQVDSSFRYINGKTTKDLSLEDLKIDSPYNSYLYKGLPPTPISNPGLDSIKAAATPIKTGYLYFLSDKGGEMHYAKTFEEHLINKGKYL